MGQNVFVSFIIINSCLSLLVSEPYIRMGGNQSKTSERRRKKEDLESGGREKTKLLTALFSSQKVTIGKSHHQQ